MVEKECHVLIKHYFLEGWLSKENKEKYNKHYGESNPWIGSVSKWFQNFRSFLIKSNDIEYSGCSFEATSPDLITIMNDLVMGNKEPSFKKHVHDWTTEKSFSIMTVHQLSKFNK